MSHIIYKICIFHNFHKKNQIKNENQEKPKKKKTEKKQVHMDLVLVGIYN